MSHMPIEAVIAHLEVISGALDRIDVQGGGNTGCARRSLQALGAHLACSPPVDMDAFERAHKQDYWQRMEVEAYELGWNAACDVFRIHTDPT